MGTPAAKPPNDGDTLFNGATEPGLPDRVDHYERCREAVVRRGPDAAFLRAEAALVAALRRRGRAYRRAGRVYSVDPPGDLHRAGAGATPRKEGRDEE